MERIQLTEENIAFYPDYIPQDMAENIGRANYRGLILTEDGEPRAGMIWELKGYLEQKPPESRIRWLSAADEAAGASLLSAYKIEALMDQVKTSSFEIPAGRDKTEKKILKNAGFSVGLTEGDEIVARLSELEEIGFLKDLQLKEEIRPFRSMSRDGLSQALHRINASGYRGRCEDIELLPRLWFDQEVSCYLERNEETIGLFLCHRLPSGRLVAELMAAMNKQYTNLLPYLISHAVKSACKIYPPDTEIVIDRHNYAVLALGEKLFPRGFGRPVYVGKREEGGA